ncbi:MAG: hypothetical protein Ta2D_04080 [Rickettsiales bacterium]|nr:MAG: hypothetical protein Ta2D_04080 [Rickettsiales bacterium]
MLRTETIDDIEFIDDDDGFDKMQEEFRKEYDKNKSVNIFSALKNKIAVL